MTIRFPLLGACLALLLVAGDQRFTWAAPPSDTLLSSATRGFVSVADVAALGENWRQTQMGQLVHDKAMQPFVEDLRRQLQLKLSGVRDKLGIELDDFHDVASGEVGLGLIERPDERAAIAFTAVVEGRSLEVEKLLARIDAELSRRRARKSTEESHSVTLTIYDIPPRGENDIARQAIYFQRDGMLCGSDSRSEVEEMLLRFGSQGGDRLADVIAYQETMKRCDVESAGLVPEVRWYVDPFGYARAVRSLSRQQKHHGKDYLQILTEQGFDAIQGAGGYVNLAVGGAYELLHRTAIYAPVVVGEPAKYRLAMRMMEFPNGTQMAPQKWIPRKLASYRTFNFDIQNGFDHFATLFDAIAGYPDAFQGVMEGLERDPYGPQVMVRKDVVRHVGQRMTIVTDYEVPITTKSERFLFIVEVTNPEAISAAVEKFMAVDPHAQRRQIEGRTVWEILQPADEFAELEIGTGELDPLAPSALPTKDGRHHVEGQVLRNSAVCVYDGHLLVASHLDFLRTILAQAPDYETLSSAGDFGEVELALNQLISGPAAARCFVRTDEAYRPTYELLRQGKMPEAETLLGRMLNRMLTPPEDEDEGILRKQKIDGRQLPNFEMVRRYFSPAGTVVRTEDDGWFVVGATLAKRAPQARAGSLTDAKARR